MARSWRSRLYGVLLRYPALLAKLGIVDRSKGEEAFELAAPVMVTGSLRVLVRGADFLMVSLALGPAAVAGLELGFQYYLIGIGMALAVSSGTISVVSREIGADRLGRANLSIKQSVWVSLVLSIPLAVATWYLAPAMIGLLSDDPQTITYGADYLRVVMLPLPLRFFSMIGARGLAGAGDTRTPMLVRTLTLPTNVVVNALLIFGLGPFPRLGIVGAAIGTATASVLAAAVFAAVLVSGRFPVTLEIGGVQFDRSLAREVVRVGLPVGAKRLAHTSGRFPFLFILGVLGTEVIAAYAIGRRVILLALMPSFGYSTAASTLVGQHVGAGDDDEAADYGWQTLRIALATQLLLGVAIVTFAEPIARLFGAENGPLTVAFIGVFALGIAAECVNRTLNGGLRGAGDLRWPFYGALVGNYLVRLPIAALALPAGYAIAVRWVAVEPGVGAGVLAVFVAILADFHVRAAVNWYRFRSGRWTVVARRSPLAMDD